MAHEFAAILQYSASYELVDWFGRQTTFAASQLAKEHEERVNLINKKLGGPTKMKKNNRSKIEMPPLPTTLVEVYKQLVTAQGAAKDMARLSKTMQKGAKHLANKWTEALGGKNKSSWSKN